MKLHHFALSSASYRVRIALALKEIDIEYVTVDMMKDEQQSEAYAELNPQRMVPCLEMDNGRILPQSIAIIDYLEHIKPECPLYPDDFEQRLIAQSHMLAVGCDTHPVQARIVQRFLRSEYGLNDDQVSSWISHWIRQGLSSIDKFLAERQNPTTYAMGEEPGIVDLFVIPQMQNAKRYSVDLADHREITALDNTCLQHPAFQAAHPEKWL